MTLNTDQVTPTDLHEKHSDDTLVNFELDVQKELEVQKETCIDDGTNLIARNSFDADDCPLCFESISMIGQLELDCKHVFCIECILRWARKSSQMGMVSCPMCRCDSFVDSKQDEPMWIITVPSFHLSASLEAVVNAMDWILCKFSSALALLDDEVGPGAIRLPENDQDLFEERFEGPTWSMILRHWVST
jgi:hypothetical protein